MVTQLKLTAKNLYDSDYHLWVLETVKQLENKEFNSLDLDNLIEEVADLSRRQKKKLKSLLRNLFEHLLKLTYWQAEIPYNKFHWKGEIRNFRKEINDELEDSPSLRNYLNDILDECYEDAKELVSDKTQLPFSTFPEKSITNLEQVLDESWFP
jgi:hypothetical protein